MLSSRSRQSLLHFQPVSSVFAHVYFDRIDRFETVPQIQRQAWYGSLDESFRPCFVCFREASFQEHRTETATLVCGIDGEDVQVYAVLD